MATSAVSRDSDVVKCYCCTICEKERSVEVDADFYCKKCLAYFCRIYVFTPTDSMSHYGKDKIMEWPLPKKMENRLLQCDTHKYETLTMYCPDHSQLCCSRCVELNHR
ncbi:hypothetical protein DPMN_062078 [Dreissena polymorpha]|uniref:B box-type domain-containing protein n=1 Tax=Dreissena polymorpha TaxID=45954 RepID=A0A9D4C864_DREPO|nr:hypothetical protein DPMN_062078 [Dreissena polymorpha]